MTPQRRRRVTPLTRNRSGSQRQTSSRPKRIKKTRAPRTRNTGDTRDKVIKSLIGVVLVVDLILILFVIRQCGSTPDAPPPAQPVPARVLQVEVLNGCGVPGLANDFTDYLRQNGVDVVKTDNYESFNVLHTVIIDRRGDIENAQRIARILGIPEDRVLQEVNEAYLIDGTVIIGHDYRQLESWKTMETMRGAQQGS